MSNTSLKEFLLEWLILHGESWIYHQDTMDKDFRLFDISRHRQYIEEEDQFPADKNRWGSYWRLTEKGRKYATMH